MTFPNQTEANGAESPSDTSPPKPPKKLLPDRSRAARDRANQKIVEFIVKSKGAEEHLLAILKSRKQSRWLKEFLNSGQYVTCVETYLEDEKQLDLVVNYLREVYHGIDAKNLPQLGGDGVKLISDVLLPEVSRAGKGMPGSEGGAWSPAACGSLPWQLGSGWGWFEPPLSPPAAAANCSWLLGGSYRHRRLFVGP